MPILPRAGWEERQAAWRWVSRRESGKASCGLPRKTGIEEPMREDLAKLDRKRKNKASNDDWFNPHAPSAQITKLKDGRTHLAHKGEHAVDMYTDIHFRTGSGCAGVGR